LISLFDFQYLLSYRVIYLVTSLVCQLWEEAVDICQKEQMEITGDLCQDCRLSSI